MSLFDTMKIAGSGMSAQLVRLNTTASNLANAGSIGSSTAETYRSRQPVFAQVLNDSMTTSLTPTGGVRVAAVVESSRELPREYRPEHPFADDQGFVTLPNVDPVEELTNMLDASRSYETNLELANAAKDLILKTLEMGQ